MSLWKRTMDYLGLGPDDAYDDYDGYDETEAQPRQGRQQREPDPRGGRAPEAEHDDDARSSGARPSFPSRDFDASAARRGQGGAPNGRSDNSGVQIRPNPQASSAPAPAARSNSGGSMEPHTVHPRRFDQAQEVADKFKDGQPVIMNLEGSERDVARRLIDFASGICYALDGSMEKVATGVYLLKPPVAPAPRDDDYYD